MTADFLFVSNDKYAKNLGICTYSVMHNMCGNVDRVRLFVMDCGVTEQNRQKLRNQASRFDNAEIIFYNIEKKLDDIMPKVETTWHKSIYGRLFLDEVARKYSIDRLIYLDCDLLMDKPVTELFTMDLQGKCMAGVVDAAANERKKALGISEEKHYINSGVLVIDTVRWIALGTSRRVIDYINSFPEALLYPDQDAINYILGDEIYILTPEYNMMWMICDSDIPKMIKHIPNFNYTPEQLKYALHNARIVHYAGHNMWSFYGVAPMQASVFKKYRRLCDWRDEKRTFNSPMEFILWFMITVKKFLWGDIKLFQKK